MYNINNIYHNNIYIYIYILYIYPNLKKIKEIHIPFSCHSNSKQKKHTKLETSNDIQYKPQRQRYQTLNKFFSSYIKYILPQL